MRQELYKDSRLQEVTEVLRVAGVPRYRRESPPGMVVEDRIATPAEAQMLANEERGIKREEAKQRAIASIQANKDKTPWAAILHDLAVAQGLIEE